MRYLLRRLRIEGFRGINNEGDPLDVVFKTDSINSIFAPNGSGKSSICDALSYALRGTIPKLENLPAADESAGYYCNRFHSEGIGTIWISLEESDSGELVEVLVLRHPNGRRQVSSPTGHSDPASLLSQLAGEATFLDQRTFLQFVDDSPLGRGRSFAALVGLEKLSMMRQALEVLANARTIKSDFELDGLRNERDSLIQTSARALAACHETYSNLTGHLSVSDLTPAQIGKAACANLKQQQIVGSLVNCDDVAQLNVSALREAIRDAEQGDKRNRLSVVIQAIASLQQLASSPQVIDTRAGLSGLITDRDHLMSNTRGLQFYELHQLLERVLLSAEWHGQEACPACLEVPEFSVRQTVATVLEQYRLVSEKTELIREMWRSSVERAQLAALEEAQLMGQARETRRSAAFDQRFLHEVPEIADVNVALAHLAELEVLRLALLAAHANEKVEIEATLPASLVDLTRSVEYVAQIVRSLTEFRQAQRSLQVVQATLQRREEWQAFITKAKEDFARAEVSLSTARVQQLEETFKPMYIRIMGHSDVIPRLQKAQGSEELHLRLESFFGVENLSANTLLSESYRNALAIAIFLSAAMQTTSGAQFLILDDVTSSFDAGHQFNVMELLRTAVARPVNPSGPQVIILSHDGLLQKYFDALSEDGGWFHQRLKGTAPRGMVFAEGIDANRIRAAAVKFLDAGEIGAGGQLVRQYLEHRLVQTIQKLSIPVPVDFAIRDDRKMVSNCLKAIEDQIELHRAAVRLILTAEQITTLHSVHMPAIAGNWVSHYETGALDSFSPSMLRGLLDTVDLVADCFKYDCACRGTNARRHYKNLSSKACNC
jgi:hypothetical protein